MRCVHLYMYIDVQEQHDTHGCLCTFAGLVAGPCYTVYKFTYVCL